MAPILFALACGGAPGRPAPTQPAGAAARLGAAEVLTTGSSAESYGEWVAGVGDVNGDGYDDLAVGAPEANSGRGAVYVYNGGAAGPDGVADVTLPGSATALRFGQFIVGAGDLDSDGYDDIAVLSDDSSGQRAYVIYGSVAGPGNGSRSNRVLRSGGTDGFGFAYIPHPPFDRLGDTNGDGYDDLLLTADHGIRVYYGSASGIPATAGTIVPEDNPTYTGWVPYAGGDLNRDGYADLAVIHEDTEYGIAYELQYFYGSATGVATTGVASTTIPQSTDYSVAAKGDVSGDGIADLAYVTSDIWFFAGRNRRNPRATPTSEVGPIDGLSFDGYRARLLGDTNGDGNAELAVSDAGVIHVYGGNATGFDEIPIETIETDWQEWGPAGDLDGDGFADLVYVTDAAELTVHYGSDADIDYDGDGSIRGDDCDDADPARVPGGPELCRDGLDGDCDGLIDEDCDGTTAAPLTDADATIRGAEGGAHLGPVTGLGDVNGDGRDDFAVGASDAYGGRGRVFVFTSAPSGAVSVSAAAAVLRGDSTSAHLGWDLVGAGDQDGDGLGDLLAATQDHGRYYLCTGPLVSMVVRSTTCDATVVNPGGTAGSSTVIGGEDLTGDGVADLVLTNTELVGLGTPPTVPRGGALLFAGPLTGTLRSGEVDAALYGSRVSGALGAGADVADMDGDGVADLVVYGPAAGYLSGAAVGIVYGPWSGSVEIGSADVYLDHLVTDVSGIAPLRVLDTNADGAPDFAMRVADDEVDVFTAPFVDLDDLDEIGPVARIVANDGRALGADLDTPGDLDGDGTDELLLGDPANGAWGTDGSGRALGAAHLLQGPLAGTFDPAAGDGRSWYGAPYGGAGTAVAAAGDVDGGGAADLLVSTPFADDLATDAGAVYLISGE